MNILRSLAISITFFVYSTVINAASVNLNINGTDLVIISESIDAVPLSESEWVFAPLFSSVQTIQASIEYDTVQPDTDPSTSTGTYAEGTLTVKMPEISLVANGSTKQISSFDNTGTGNDEFFTFVEGRDTFSSDVGLPTTALSWSIALVGDASMLSNDTLPTSELIWESGNFSVSFAHADGSNRQILMSFSPALVSEDRPFPIYLLVIALLILLLLLIFILLRCRKDKS